MTSSSRPPDLADITDPTKLPEKQDCYQLAAKTMNKAKTRSAKSDSEESYEL